MTSATETRPARSAVILQLVRSLIHLIAVVSVTVWGFTAWPLPFPGVLTGIGFLVLSVLLWAMFLSPRPVLRTDRYAQALFDLLLLAAAVGALLALGVFWVWPTLYGVVGAVLGYIVSMRPASTA
ncbi:MAG: DUF2568 domain-containing protein [Leucobacter sp.]